MGALRPIERRLLVLRSQGKSYQELGPMFRRSPAHLERVMRFVDLKLQKK